VVLEELDAGKKGLSEVARNARQASRFLDELIHGQSREAIEAGLPLPSGGRLFLQTQALDVSLPEGLPGSRPDNIILGITLALEKARPDEAIVLVSKDINLRIKAAAMGIRAEDYHNDQVLEDASLLYTGFHELPGDFWETHGKDMDSWKEEGRTFYRIHGPLVKAWYPNQCLYDAKGFEALVREVKGETALIEHARDFRKPNHTVWGIRARNLEQNFALNLLMDPDIDFVSLVGAAGTGKTLLTLAAGLIQTFEERRYQEIIMTRATVPVGEDIGFLPGTEEEKMTPWMGALQDNLEVLTESQQGNRWEKAVTGQVIGDRVKVHSLNFMRGRTFLRKYLILDEAQNLTSKQMKTLITRAGPGTKVVALGNIAQIDTPYLTETTSGLTYAVDRFKAWPHSGHILLRRGERSRLADFASEAF
ncbi:MAG: PhoH family protein, partial [Gammaproteobacteria bacterium]